MAKQNSGIEIKGSPSSEIKPPRKRTVFISYSDDSQKNRELVEKKLRLFLTNLGFSVKTFRDARSSSYFKSEIDRLIDDCNSLIAFLTKDVPEEGVEKWHPSGNIPGEIERALAKEHRVILYHEEGVTIPSNTKSYYCRPFTNDMDHYLDLFIDLAKALNNEGLI